MGISVMCVVSIGEERVRDAADRIRAESGGQRTDRTHQQGGADRSKLISDYKLIRILHYAFIIALF